MRHRLGPTRLKNSNKTYLWIPDDSVANADNSGWDTISTSAQPLNVSWGPQPTASDPLSHLPQLLP